MPTRLTIQDYYDTALETLISLTANIPETPFIEDNDYSYLGTTTIDQFINNYFITHPEAVNYPRHVQQLQTLLSPLGITSLEYFSNFIHQFLHRLLEKHNRLDTAIAPLPVINGETLLNATPLKPHEKRKDENYHSEAVPPFNVRVSGTQGRRPHQEDTQLLRSFDRIPDDQAYLIPSILRETILSMHKAMRADCDSIAGTTAVLVYIHGDDLYIVSTGDSSAKLFIQGNNQTFQHLNLSIEHELSDFLCNRYVILQDGTVCTSPRNTLDKTLRIDGELGVGRALGDKRYNNKITADPDIYCFSISALAERYGVRLRDLRIILSCDGAFEKPELTSQNYCQLFTAKRQQGDLSALATFMRDAAFNAGSGDNISVIELPIGRRYNATIEKDGLVVIFDGHGQKGQASQYAAKHFDTFFLKSRLKHLSNDRTASIASEEGETPLLERAASTIQLEYEPGNDYEDHTVEGKKEQQTRKRLRKADQGRTDGEHKRQKRKTPPTPRKSAETTDMEENDMDITDTTPTPAIDTQHTRRYLFRNRRTTNLHKR